MIKKEEKRIKLTKNTDAQRVLLMNFELYNVKWDLEPEIQMSNFTEFTNHFFFGWHKYLHLMSWREKEKNKKINSNFQHFGAAN